MSVGTNTNNMSYTSREKREMMEEGRRNGSLDTSSSGGSLSRDSHTMTDDSGNTHEFRYGHDTEDEDGGW